MSPKVNYPSVPQTAEELKREARQLTRMLKGKVVSKVWRHRPGEIGIEFADGMIIYVDKDVNGLQTSLVVLKD